MPGVNPVHGAAGADCIGKEAGSQVGGGRLAAEGAWRCSRGPADVMKSLMKMDDSAMLGRCCQERPGRGFKDSMLGYSG